MNSPGHIIASGTHPIRLHDYEVALRDILKFRKNLKREDWYAIGVGISHRKKQGKDSEVLWNNSPMATSKVRKEVLRNRKPNHFYPRHSKLLLSCPSSKLFSWLLKPHSRSS